MPVAGLALRTNVDQVFRELDAYVAQASIAGARALNALESKATTPGFRKIAEEWGIGVRKVQEHASVKLATPADLELVVTVKGKGFPLADFSPSPTRRGVTCRIKGRRVLFPGTFMARMPSGHVGVFARGAYGGKGATAIRPTGSIGRFVLGRGKRVRRANKWGSTELPINELYTSGPAEMFAEDAVVDVMLDAAEAAAPDVMRRELDAVRRGF